MTAFSLSFKDYSPFKDSRFKIYPLDHKDAHVTTMTLRFANGSWHGHDFDVDDNMKLTNISKSHAKVKRPNKRSMIIERVNDDDVSIVFVCESMIV